MSRPVADSTAIQQYDHAWNAAGVDERRALLEAALTEDCELVEPRGRYVGREAIIERIAGFAERFPGATVKITTNVDEHNHFARYAWRIVDRDGAQILSGIDVVEHASDGRLRKVVMFLRRPRAQSMTARASRRRLSA